jgi:hypothetical protein
MLELCAGVLVLMQIGLSRLAIDDLPSTVVPYFSPSGLGLPGAETEARLWIWMVIGFWSVLLGTSLWLHRAAGSSPVPIITVAALAFLAVLRAGVIALNLDPALTPSRVLFRAATAGLVVLLLGAGLERWRTRQRLVPALMRPAAYDEPAPRGPYYVLVGLLGLGLPWLFLPTRIRVMDDGLVAVTPVSYLWLPAPAIEAVEEASAAQAVLGTGINLVTSPLASVRIRRRRRWLPFVLSAADRPRFIAALRAAAGCPCRCSARLSTAG